MVKRSRIVCGGMLRENTPIQDYTKEYGLWVKREDLACPKPGPAFSKTRGVYARVESRPEQIIGVLDTRHSQAGWAVARACQILGKRCINYYPEFKYEPGPKEPQMQAKSLGAKLVGIPAGRSSILYHQAKKQCEGLGGYMMPNALKLDESVLETAKECNGVDASLVIVPISSGTIAAGVVMGMINTSAKFLIHLGYSRSLDEVRRYIKNRSGLQDDDRLIIVDEEYQYKDPARPGPTPTWPCNEYYDLKAFRWWMEHQSLYTGRKVLFWNIG